MPPFFDSTDWSDPQTMAAMQSLGSMAGSFADSAMPSRMPVPLGAVLGHAGQAMTQGAVSGATGALGFRRGQQEIQQGQLGLEQGNLGIAQTLARLNYFRQQSGQPPLNASDLASGKFSLTNGAAPGAGPAIPANVPGGPPSDPTLQPQLTAPVPAPSSNIASPIFGNAAATIPVLRTAESDNNPNAVSPKGATGPMQVMPATAASPGYGVRPAANSSTAENDREGSDYFNAMLTKYNGNTTRALAAYNWGPGNTDKWVASGADPKKLPPSVKQYIGAIAAGTPISAIPRAQAPSASAAAPDASPQNAASPTASPMSAISSLGQYDPDSAFKLMEKFEEPQNMRQGSEVRGMDPATGKMVTYARAPVLGEGQTEDDVGNVSMLPGAVSAISQTEGAKHAGTLPYNIALAKAKAIANAGGKMMTDRAENYMETGGIGLGTADGGIRQPAGPGALPGLPGAPVAPIPGSPAPAVSPAQPGAPAGQNAPLTGSTAGVKSIIPPLSAAAPINPGEIYLKDRIPQWTKQEDDWGDALPSNITGEQRALAIADAFKKTESGKWAQEKADVKASLKAVGIDLPDNELGDPAQVQTALKDNFSSTLAQVRAFTSRPAAVEVTLAQKNFANPDLQPQANLNIIGQTVGSLRWERSLINDWSVAKKEGWQDPQDFQRAWVQANPLQKYIDSATKSIGPLKGMSAAPSMPDAALKSLKPNVITHFKNGQAWMLGPDGKPEQVK